MDAEHDAFRVEGDSLIHRRRVLFAGGSIGVVVLLMVALVVANAAGLGSGGWARSVNVVAGETVRVTFP